jgi:hypothetical protein
MNRKLVRTFFLAALGLYLLWVAALIIMGVVSGDRPGAGRARPAPAFPQHSQAPTSWRLDVSPLAPA